ncbi:molybdopterin-dependent oxidoreductase [Dehalococcoidia bacterium]|nr:molybdopterin-dependent oxidoreductase [Dehalococcoidia bacterium]
MSNGGNTARTFCRLCMGHCSILVTVEEGKVTGVAANREGPVDGSILCAKGLALPEILNHPECLTFPLRRKGDRGGGTWERLSWGDALGDISDKLKKLKQDFGSECVVLGQPKGLELAFAQRFASAFGTPNISTPGHICHMPRELASNYTFGSPCVPDSKHQPHCIVIWGSNPLHTHRISPTQLNSALAGGVKLIVIDPRKTNLASRADIWVRPRPGSDGALALGMIKTIIEEHLYDAEFEWVVGFERLEEHVKTFSLEEVGEVTWVPHERIKQAARLYVKARPAAIQWGNALDQTANSFQACRAVSILRALGGNLDVPGGDLLTIPLSLAKPGHFMLLRQFPRKPGRMVGGEFKLAARSMFISRQSSVKAILKEKPYPVRAALLFGTNLSYPNADKAYKAMMKLELLVVADLFMTPTSRRHRL